MTLICWNGIRDRRLVEHQFLMYLLTEARAYSTTLFVYSLLLQMRIYGRRGNHGIHERAACSCGDWRTRMRVPRCRLLALASLPRIQLAC